jgi:hypothetical protein
MDVICVRVALCPRRPSCERHGRMQRWLARRPNGWKMSFACRFGISLVYGRVVCNISVFDI